MAMRRRLRTTLKCMCHSAHIFRCSYSSRATRRLLVDNGCGSPELCDPIQYCLACRNLSIPPESLFFINVSTANVRCSSDHRCMMAEGFNPLYPAVCVSPRHLQRWRHGAKFKSSNCFYPTLYFEFL